MIVGVIVAVVVVVGVIGTVISRSWFNSRKAERRRNEEIAKANQQLQFIPGIPVSFGSR